MKNFSFSHEVGDYDDAIAEHLEGFVASYQGIACGSRSAEDGVESRIVIGWCGVCAVGVRSESEVK